MLLDGPIGAGKTHFSRCLIQALLSVPEDVPSPTFTIVQVYDTARFEVWHVDLYRITGPDGCIELGLTEAFETALCLVEWPDRLGILTPPNALAISLSTGAHDEDRTLVFAWTAQRWAPILDEVLA